MKIGLLGLGTVGGGVYRIVENCRERWESKYGEKINIKSILVKDMHKKRSIRVDSSVITDKALEIVKDPEIDTIIELIGGNDKAFELIVKAMESGKNVVTGNKAVVSEQFTKLIETAVKNGVYFGYEASVCGGIPIIKTLNQMKDINDIDYIKGVLNGTTNYILDKMSREKIGYALSLKQAQEIGYAESDPTADVEGFDAQRKLAILCSIAYDIHLKPEMIPCMGISKITGKDVSAVKHMGYIPKLFAYAKKKDHFFNACVEPVLVDRNDVFANIPGAKNMVAVNGNYIGELQLDGEGAGMFPTANAVVSDLLDILGKSSPSYPEFGRGKLSFLGMEGCTGRYYVRISPGENRIIESLLAEIERENVECKIFKDRDDLIMVTEKTSQKRIYDYMKAIDEKNWSNCFMRIAD